MGTPLPDNDIRGNEVADLDSDEIAGLDTSDPEYEARLAELEAELAEAFGWGMDDFRALNTVAIDAAFCDEDTRTRVKKELEKA